MQKSEVGFLHKSHLYELWNLKKISYVKDSLHLKWMHTHSYEPRVMTTIITVENHQSTTSFNSTNKLTVPWIHSNMISSFIRFSQILCNNLSSHRYEEYEVYFLRYMHSLNFCFHFFNRAYIKLKQNKHDLLQLSAVTEWNVAGQQFCWGQSESQVKSKNTCVWSNRKATDQSRFEDPDLGEIWGSQR